MENPGLTRSELIDKTGAPNWLIDRLRADRKLPQIRKPVKRGSPAEYDKICIKILRAYQERNSCRT